MAGGLEAECCFVCSLVHVHGWLKVLPLLCLVVIAVVLCYALDLACEMLPRYCHDVEGCVFVALWYCCVLLVGCVLC